MAGDPAFRTVVGVDGSAESRTALEWAVAEARFRGGSIRLITAWHIPPVITGMEGLVWDAEAFPRAAQVIQSETLKLVDTAGVPLTADVEKGAAASVLMKASKDADLLVVGCRGLGGFTGLHLGSVSAHLVTHAACPVLVVRARPQTHGRD